MSVNKVILNGSEGENVLIDLTSDTVTPENLEEGVTAHDASGKPIVGTRKFELTWEMLDEFMSPHDRRNKIRGKNLGSSLTPEQKANIANGSHKGFFIGDYWVIDGITWRIVDIDYWLYTGVEPSCITPHLVIMPDTQLYKAQMNSTDTTAGAYMGSEMYTKNLAEAKTIINSVFGAGNILNHMELLTKTTTNGYASAGEWAKSTVELPDEFMMYGSNVMSPASTGTAIPYNCLINKSQLALFKLQHNFINRARQNFWLRNVVSASRFAAVFYPGMSNSVGASTSIGVRPVFGITGLG